MTALFRIGFSVEAPVVDVLEFRALGRFSRRWT